ncbi:RDD family protein [Acinetobacter sichuanensis]|uniref:RDD family protein n=1 Tax=Acinetobacter sichuanensis TaxID=2136183 RepID=UPI00281023C4|nr:RDD family protein [Acinetobacter sichuanensis]MDQ9020137.1 RDD family protein [Acinetobacter sichuanensis]
MQIYLARNNQQAGPYTVEQLNQMLASQQVLLTDLAWHQGMTEWKALGELTQGKLVYEPTGYISSTPTYNPNPFQENSKVSLNKQQSQTELAPISSRVLAKIIDMLLWLPAAYIPMTYLKPEQLQQLVDIQAKMQSKVSAAEATKLQEQFIMMFPMEAWQMMGLYIVIMLAIQGFLVFKSGQSIGKKLAKIKIVDMNNGQQVSGNRSFLIRSVLFTLFTIISLPLFPLFSLIDYIFAINQNRQTLHDKLAKTKVIKQ